MPCKSPIVIKIVYDTGIVNAAIACIEKLERNRQVVSKIEETSSGIYAGKTGL